MNQKAKRFLEVTLRSNDLNDIYFLLHDAPSLLELSRLTTLLASILDWDDIDETFAKGAAPQPQPLIMHLIVAYSIASLSFLVPKEVRGHVVL